MKLKPATDGQLYSAQLALRLLREALKLLKEADTPRTSERLRATIKSAEGAVRHAYRRRYV